MFVDAITQRQCSGLLLLSIHSTQQNTVTAVPQWHVGDHEPEEALAGVRGLHTV